MATKIRPYMKPVEDYGELEDELLWRDGRRKRKQAHDQGGHTKMWDAKKIEGRRVRV